MEGPAWDACRRPSSSTLAGDALAAVQKRAHANVRVMQGAKPVREVPGRRNELLSRQRLDHTQLAVVRKVILVTVRKIRVVAIPAGRTAVTWRGRCR